MSMAIVETLERNDIYARKAGEIVGKGPHKMIWVRRQVRSISYSGWNGGYSIGNRRGATGFYPEQNVRNIQVVITN